MLFDSSVRSELARSFGVTFVVILTIVLTMMLIRTLGQAAGGNVAPQDVMLLMAYASLSHLPTMLTLSLFIAVVASLGRMYRESEMTIWFSSGIGLSRFVKPVLRMSLPVLLVVIVLQLIVWPWGNQNSAQLRERYQKRSDLSRVAPGQFQSSRDGNSVFFIERDSQDERTGRNVFILSNKDKTESVTTASKGHIELTDTDRFLVLNQGQRNEANALTGERSLAKFEQYRILADSQVLRSADKLKPKATPTLDLLRAPSAANNAELTWRFGMSLACFNMMFLGIGMAATNPRRANNWNLLFALLSFVVYFNLIGLSQGWVSNGRSSMGTTLLAVHGGIFLLALAVMWLRDRGNCIGFFRRKPAGVGA
ncbi:LPS export ABC transporter permease LptF [Roseateles oligotrophus]|uniref:Lipopolysaccharide export system permease protein LptF n=1 Tax=Roseateles oligotrophus TaxID=1769250 RepID=A0ABT2YF74_9BURK|nr:LPS export ABC transporter permease LptF [Roseateles oligotrophus]MCV2368706.1 LPS export ABC transporter permease LptF [Roseateles oligotrophus]